MAKVQKCPRCKHTFKVHTSKAHNGKGGCAYCKCIKIVRKIAGADILIDRPEPTDG